jgi:primosomal protein N'
LVTRLREMAKERFVIQTRNAGQEVLEFAAAGNILDFYRTEIKDREDLRYPPFSIFAKVSTEDDRERIERKAAHLQDLFKDYEPHFMLENKGVKGKRTLSMILRFERDIWPIDDVAQKLLLLTPDFEVKVDPESIL